MLTDTILSLAQACLSEKEQRLAAVEEAPVSMQAQLREDAEYENLASYSQLLALLNSLSQEQRVLLSAIAESGFYTSDTIDQRASLQRVSAALTSPEWLVAGITRAVAEQYDLSSFSEG